MRESIKPSTSLKSSKPLLGRWNIDDCHQKTNMKVDLSNEDHCGPCGQYIISKRTESPVSVSLSSKPSDTKDKSGLNSII